ncbi:MAG TPA: hypothetical protein VLI90_07145, partial [Tepidisphaeraceae bacterium]|nr:hypothetical protein [Tepidisphaeraceae bacterium]
IPASGGAVAVAGDALGRQFIAYFDTVDSDLKYFTRMPNGAVSPDRVIDASPGAGAQLAIAVQHNLPVVAYYDSTAQQLKFARMINGVWHKTVVDQTGNVGQNPSIAIDAAGNAAISYYDVTNGDLKVARQTGKTFSVTTIDSTGDVGLFSSIALNPATHLLGIAYQDTTGGVLKLATEGTSGFTPAAIPGTIATGQAPSLAFDSAGNTFVSFFNSLAAGGPAVDVLEFTNSAWATVEHFTLSGAGATAGSIETIFPTAATAALPLIVFTDTASHALLLGQHSTTTGDATSMLFNDAGPIAAASAGATNKLDLITQPTGAAYSLLLIQDATAIAPAVPAGVFNATIPANAEISGAGNAGLPDATGGVAPIGFNIPAGVTRVQLSSVTGTISLNSGAGTNDADGVVVTGTYPTTLANASQMGAFGGLSGITIPGAGALVGVFVGATVPSGSPPADLDYTTLGTTAASSTPLLNQVFYIGDGKTADGSGAVQSFIIPSGATKLFLGISDAQNFAGAPGSYGDNSGNFAVTLNFGG